MISLLVAIFAIPVALVILNPIERSIRIPVLNLAKFYFDIRRRLAMIRPAAFTSQLLLKRLAYA